MSRSEIIFLVLVVLLVMGIMLASPTVPRGQYQAVKAVDWAQAHDDPTQKLTISWMGPAAVHLPNKGTWVEKFLEKKFNVEFEPTFLDWDAYGERRPLMMASGDIPDVNWDGDPTFMRQNIQQGFVMELPYEVIMKYAPTYVSQFNRIGTPGWIYPNYKGKNYGIPTYEVAGLFTPIAAWRMDWLRKVGINKVPETIDEMHEAFRRFRYNDPDGNGLKDTYGYDPTLPRVDMNCNELYCAYGILPQDFIMYHNKVTWGGLTPEAKKVLTLLHQWYAEGLIDPDCVTITNNTSDTAGNSPDTKFLNGRLGYMIMLQDPTQMDLHLPQSTYSKMRALNPKAELAPGKPLIGLDGKRRERVWGGSGHIIWFGKQMAQHPEKVIRVLRMFEAYAKDRDLYITSRIGKRGLHWAYDPHRGAYALPPYDKPGEDIRNMLRFDALEMCFGYYSCSGVPLEYTRDLLPKGMEAYRMEYANPAWGISEILGKADVVPSAGLYLEDLRTFQSTAYLEMIRGDKPLSYFDEFVEEWRRRGGDILTREANDVIKEMPVIYRKVGVELKQQ